MPNSQEFKSLARRVGQLKKHLLPRPFSQIGAYSDAEQDCARGFRLLVHAEFESFIENAAQRVITAGIKNWKQTRIPGNLLLAFITCYHSAWIEFDELHTKQIIELARSRKAVKERIEEIVDLAQTQYINRLKENHGIRDKNLKTLLLPTGLDFTTLNQTWLTAMDEFGKARGAIAHLPVGTTGSVNPEDEFKRVKELLIGLRELDEKLTAMS